MVLVPSIRNSILTVSCPDGTGIVAAITGFIAERGGLITEAAHFVDEFSDRSFMRTTFRGDQLPEREELARRFGPVAQKFRMDWALHDATARCRVLVAVSKQGHCLNSLLHRWSIGVLPIDLVGVVSNHDTHQRRPSGTACRSTTFRSRVVARWSRRRGSWICSTLNTATCWFWPATCRS